MNKVSNLSYGSIVVSKQQKVCKNFKHTFIYAESLKFKYFAFAVSEDLASKITIDQMKKYFMHNGLEIEIRDGNRSE